jgi:predicted porin
MGGFTANLQVTSLNATFNTVETTAAEGRAMGLGVQFATGPLAIVAAFDKRDENRSDAGGLNGEDTAWLAGVRYRIGPVTLGFTYTDLEADDGVGGVVARTAWNLAGEWQIGAGAIRVGYANADDTEVNGSDVTDTGAVQYQVGYWHNLSKRTKVYAAYVKLDNDSAGVYNLTGLAAGGANVFPGDSADVVAVGMFHSF